MAVPNHSIRISIDRLLSQDPGNYKDAPTEGVRRALERITGNAFERGKALPVDKIGEKHALVITKGFKDLLEIGNQARPRIFDLNIRRAKPLYSTAIEVDERVTLDPKADKNALVFNDDGTIKRAYSGVAAEEQDRFVPGRIVKGLSGEAVKILKEPGLLERVLRWISRKRSSRRIHGFRRRFGRSQRESMIKTNSADPQNFSGLKSILSGPAGGVVGCALTSWDEEERSPVIGCLTYKNGLFRAGPESAGAHPGPACYRESTSTILLADASFPKCFGPNEDQDLDPEVSKVKFEELAQEIRDETGTDKTIDEIVANETMARPIRTLTEARGFKTDEHILASFGGAGGQHACEIAEVRGIGKTFESLGPSAFAEFKSLKINPVHSNHHQDVYVWYGQEGKRQDVPVFELSSLKKGDQVQGPALIIDETQTIFVNM
ncbi:uncharacterized protein IL334_001212 [Kwoniella shivajii]|uniref:Hydantoinase A/oxoprolinase domain-containing protein n=1 Tax=Kwoniella shivajii TaxID=564305 RepID=A0ABZ1CUD8_9TREE|nr:hypothetical protein IL334_001212 [Kwoniella shivajii]